MMAGLGLWLTGHGIPALLERLSLPALRFSRRDPQKDGKGHIDNILA